MANIPNNQIHYTSSDGNVVTPYSSNVFGANITDNTYENGVGIITFDGNVTSIGMYAFQGCSGLTSVTIGNSVTSIEESAFTGCTNLTSITIGNSVINIGIRAFNTCIGLTSITIPDSVTSIGDSAFVNCIGLTSVTIPNSVTTIGNAAFYNCTGLTSVTIGNSVTSIGEGAFRSCSSLTSATIGDSVESIGSFVFYGCSNLTHIICMPQTSPTLGDFSPIPDTTKIFVPRQLLETYKSTWSSYSERIFPITFIRMKKPKNVIYYTSNNGVVTPYASNVFGANIVSNTYENGVGIITFDGGVTSIGNYAFNSTSLTSIEIPDSVTSVGNNAFAGCTSLTSVTIPDSVINIGSGAFNNCSSLTSVIIPNSVTNIRMGAFQGCSGITSITSLNTTPPTLGNSTLPTHTTYIIYVPAGSVEAYKTKQYWKNKASQIQAIQ